MQINLTFVFGIDEDLNGVEFDILLAGDEYMRSLGLALFCKNVHPHTIEILQHSIISDQMYIFTFPRSLS